MICPLCDTELKERIDKEYYICTKCEAYVKDCLLYLSSEEEKKRYENHNNDVNDKGYQLFTSPITNSITKRFNSNSLGLDYGSGTGPVITKTLTDLGYKIINYDPFFYPDKTYLNYYYDFIFSCEVFEHFYQPKQEIIKLLNLIKKRGYLIIMTHIFDKTCDFKNWYYRNDPTHVFIFTSKTLKFIESNYNLHIEELTDRLVVFRKNN